MSQEAKPQKLAGMVEYQEGSVVSKTILEKETGTVTLFAFDKGQALSEHTAPFDAIVQVLDGQAEVIVSGDSHVMAQGELIILPANVPHALKAVEQFKMMLIMIKSTGIACLDKEKLNQQ